MKHSVMLTCDQAQLQSDFLSAIDSSSSQPFSLQDLARKLFAKTMEEEGCPYPAKVEILLTDDENIHSINREQRGIDAATDVLSFPSIDFPQPADYSILTEDDPAYYDPEDACLFLGDVVLSLPHVTAQAEAYGHSIMREYAFLLTHSFLHLLGYDHEDEVAAAVMEEKQAHILETLEITRNMEGRTNET